MFLLKFFQKLWSVPPLSWLKQVFVTVLRRQARRHLERGWKKELKTMDWLETSAASEKPDPFELWEALMIQLASEYEKGEITVEEVADFLIPKEDSSPLHIVKTQNAELNAIIHKIQSKPKTENPAPEKMARSIENISAQVLSPEKKELLLKRLKALEAQNAEIEKNNRRIIAANPEMIEGIGSDRFVSTEQNIKQTKKIIDSEKKVMREKINTKTQADKTMKQIGAEKQKALEKLKAEEKNKGTTETSA